MTVDGTPVGVVLVSRSPSALFRGMWEDRGKIAAGIATIFALLVLLTAILTRAIIRPVEQLSAATKALARGEAAQPPHPTLKVREIESLSEDFASMAEAIARRTRYLRDFAASLSHEFKTPLAGLRGGIELLQDHGASMTSSESESFLANMACDAERLSRLVTRMMKLAQADMTPTGTGGLANLQTVLSRLTDAMQRKNFAIVTSVPADLPKLAITEPALETILATLIENAAQAGSSRLAISTDLDRRMVTILLADNGKGIVPDQRTRVFDPFYSSKRDSGGTGLGLPIARALANGSNGSLELRESMTGACLELRLPVAART